MEDADVGVASAQEVPEAADAATAPQSEPQQEPQPRKRHGCRSCALGCLGALLALLLVVVVAIGYVFNWPRQWGWTASPSEELFATSPNPWAAEAILAELKKQDISTEGTTIYVLRSLEGTGAVAYVLLEDARGFVWKMRDHKDYRNAIEGLLVRVGSTKAAKRYGVVRIAVDHRDEKGVQAAVMTVPTSVAIAYGKQKISRDEFLDELKGNADFTGFMAGMSE